MSVTPRNVAASHGWRWFRQGWQGFARAPGMLLGVLLLWLIIAIGLEFIPLLGSLVMMVISPALFGGYLIICRSAIAGNDPSLEQFFAGLTRSGPRNNAIILGLLLLAGYVMIMLVCGLFFILTALTVLGQVPWETLTELKSGSADDVVINMGLLLVLILTTLLAVTLYTVLAVAFTYASPLVVDDRAGAIDAIRLSLAACLANILPLTLFGILYLVFFMLAALPLLLGLIVFVPVSLAAVAASYDDMLPEG